jgi:hypothetical protein
MHRALRLLVLALVLAASARLGAIPRGPLPALDLTSIDGQRVPTSQIAMQGTWLIVYVQPGCDPCEAILKAAAQHDNPSVVDRLVLIVRSQAVQEVQALAERHPRVPRHAWYLDNNSEMFTRLGLSGAPVVIGLRGTVMEWSLAGVLADARAVGSVLGSWVARS